MCVGIYVGVNMAQERVWLISVGFLLQLAMLVLVCSYVVILYHYALNNNTYYLILNYH